MNYGKCDLCNKDATTIILRGYQTLRLCKFHGYVEKQKHVMERNIRRMETDLWVEEVKRHYK